MPDPNLPVVGGIDFGLTPAATFSQQRPNGQWITFKELVATDLGIKNFGERVLLPYLLKDLLDFEVKLYGDPAGSGGSQIDKQTPFEILEFMGFDIEPAPSQDPMLRREALAAPLSRLVDGEPGMLVDPSCKTLRKGLSSKFIYKRMKVVGDEKYHDKPDKNFWSHVCEAQEYGMVGAGEGLRITRRPSEKARPRPRRNLGKYGYMAA